MDQQRILDELLRILEVSGVTVRREPLGGSGGGLCTIKSGRIFFVDTQSPLAETSALCVEAIGKAADIEKIYIRPEVRQFIENHSGRGRGCERSVKDSDERE